MQRIIKFIFLTHIVEYLLGENIIPILRRKIILIKSERIIYFVICLTKKTITISCYLRSNHLGKKLLNNITNSGILWRSVSVKTCYESIF